MKALWLWDTRLGSWPANLFARIFVMSFAKLCTRLIGRKSWTFSAPSFFGRSVIYAELRSSKFLNCPKPPILQPWYLLNQRPTHLVETTCETIWTGTLSEGNPEIVFQTSSVMGTSRVVRLWEAISSSSRLIVTSLFILEPRTPL